MSPLKMEEPTKGFNITISENLYGKAKLQILWYILRVFFYIYIYM